MIKSLILATVIILNAKIPTKPELKRDLHTGNYKATNTLLVPITMKINCLGDFEPVFVTVPARTSTELEIKTNEGDSATCLLDSWVKT